jgi:hypothetical protein
VPRIVKNRRLETHNSKAGRRRPIVLFFADFGGTVVSFDIFLACVKDGESAAFKRILFEDIFSRGAINPRLPFTNVVYGDGGAQIDGADEHEDIESLSFNHCGGDTFFATLYELADRSGSVVFWPGEERVLAVTSQAMIAHIPADMDELGPAHIVSNGRELQNCIFGEG